MRPLFIRPIAMPSETMDNPRICKRSLEHHRACLIPETYPPTEVFISDSGVQSQVTRYPLRLSQNDTTPTHVILVPGNPGVVTYYQPFMHSLWQRLSQRDTSNFHLHAVGIPGHDFKSLNAHKRFGISDHVDFYVSYVKHIVWAGEQQQTKPNIILLGHSYGSYLALKIIENLPSNLYKHVTPVMLMPCMWEMGNCAGAVLRTFLQDWFRIVIWFLALIISLIPPLVRDFSIRLCGHRPEVVAVTQELTGGLTRMDMYSNMAYLARQEMREIRSPVQLKGIAKVTLALAVYVDHDKWCPPEAEAAIEQAFGRAKLDVKKLGGSVDHAFVLKTAETDKVVEAVADWVEQQF